MPQTDLKVVNVLFSGIIAIDKAPDKKKGKERFNAPERGMVYYRRVEQKQFFLVDLKSRLAPAGIKHREVEEREVLRDSEAVFLRLE